MAISEEMRRELRGELESIRAAGLWKEEREIASPQDAVIRLADGREVINMCANNYLGLASHPEVIAAARAGLDGFGYGMASVRFICGSQTIHRELEAAISRYLGTEDTILYAACFDANGGVFEPLLGADDAIVSDSLNHASIIDGVRLCKARRFRFPNRDMNALEDCLRKARDGGARRLVIATDGVFSMDGTFAPLAEICGLADRFGALVMVDDCHATGFVGPTGRGTPEAAGVRDRVDIVTGTLGKALGGASGGFTSGRSEIIGLLRQRSRPYLFSNSLAPPIVAASLKVLQLVGESNEFKERLEANTARYRSALREGGIDVPAEGHPIVPIMLGDAERAQSAARLLLERGVYAVGFFFPVVPEGTARVRTQVTAAHTLDHLDAAARAIADVVRELQLAP